MMEDFKTSKLAAKVAPLKRTFPEKVSAFKDVFAKESKTITLARWLQSTMHPATKQEMKRWELVEKIRSGGYTGKKSEIKKQLPGITPSALFEPNSERLEKNITNVTGWMQVDIDLKNNPRLPDATTLRNAISYNPYIAFCGLSVSGNGVWGLVKVSNPDEYKRHFEQLVIDFKDNKAPIELDTTKGRNPHDLRFYSYDPDAYVNPSFRIYDRIKTPKPPNKPNYNPLAPNKETPNSRLIEAALNLIESERIDITSTYEAWFQCGCVLANEFGEDGRDYFHRISQYYPGYDPDESDKQFNECLKEYNFNIGTFLDWCSQYGIFVKEQLQISSTSKIPRQAPKQPSKPRKDETSEYFTTSTGVKVWDKSGLLRASGLDFLCDPELEEQWNKPITEAESKFEQLANKKPKLRKLQKRLNLKIE